MAENNKPHGFNEQGARRVVDATRRVEQMPRDQRGRNNPPMPREGGGGFWAVIAYQDISEPVYAFHRVTRNDAGQLVVKPGTLTQGAEELNGRVGVLPGSRVRMFRIGTNENDDPVFGFFAPQPREQFQPIEPHDHRDIWNGGFAFSVYHPGTSLPQMPWAL